MTNSTLNTRATEMGSAVLLSTTGVLDGATYLGMRDTIVEAALEHPSAVIVDITGLVWPAESALAVFTSARWHINRWPNVPMLLVCADAAGRDALRRNGITRSIPVHSNIDDAIAELPQAVVRRRAHAELAADPASIALARELIAGWLLEWAQTDLLMMAKVVVTVFVENALQHTDGPLRLRLESRAGEVAIAVEDNSRAPAEFQEDARNSQQLSSLKIVDVLCRTWGSNPIPTGKAVWGVIASEKFPRD